MMILFTIGLYFVFGIMVGMLIEAIWRPLTHKWDKALEDNTAAREANTRALAALSKTLEPPEIPDGLEVDDDPSTRHG